MRSNITRDVEFVSEASKTPDTIFGYASVFNQPTEINSMHEGRFVERVAPGAFSKTLSEGKKPLMQWNHGKDSRVGATPIGVYDELAEDGHGLKVQGTLFDNDVVKPVRQAIQAGAITGQSFTFQVIRDEWTNEDGTPVTGRELSGRLFNPGEKGPLQRTIKEVKLLEAGPVAYPAYSDTSVGVRSADEAEPKDREALISEYCRSSRLTVEPEPLIHFHIEGLQEIPAAATDDANRETVPVVEIKEDSAGAVERDTPVTPGSEPAPEGNADATRTLPDKKEEERAKPAPVNARKKIMTLTELRERLATILVRQEELATEFESREMPEADETEYDGLKAERTGIEAKITKIEARLEDLKGAATDTKRTERGSDVAVHVKKTADEVFDIEAVRRDSYNDEDLVERLRDNALRANEVVKFGGGSKVKREDAQAQIEHFLMDKDTADGTFAKRMLVTGSPAYERAWSKALREGSPAGLFGEEARALSLGSDGAGGYAVPVQLDPTVIWTSHVAIDPLRSISRVEQIVGKEWQGVTSAGTSVTRSAEAAEVGDNSFTLTSKVVRTQRVAGFVPFSYEIAETWGQARSEITAALGDAKAREEATSFLTGDGTGTNANGLLGTLSGNTVTSSASSTFTAANVYALEEALDPRYRPNGKFLANRGTYNRIRQFDTAGGAQLWERIGAGQPSELLGYPALESSEMVAALTTGNKTLLFGDFQNFLIVDRIGMSVELIPQVFGASGRPTGQRGIYAIWMNNAKVLVDAGFKVLVVS